MIFKDLLNICILLSVNEKSAEILNSQISCMNENNKQIMDKEDNNFKTAKEGKEY